MNRPKRRDVNEPDIVQALVAAGCSVTRLSDAGVPDLLVGRNGVTWLMEVKRPLGARGGLPARREHEGGRGDMTEAQVRWHGAWKGEEVHIVRTVEDALNLIGVRAASLYMTCAHCGGLELPQPEDKSKVSYHTWPKGTRAVCRGANKPPRRNSVNST